jgi:hypothetical protein
LRIVFDKNVPVGVRRFLSRHEVRTFVEAQWHPQLENGDLLNRGCSGLRLIPLLAQNGRLEYMRICIPGLLGSAQVVGPQAVSAGVRGFSLTVQIRNRFTSDLAFEFKGAPIEEALQILTRLGGATLDGNVAHARVSMDAYEVQQRFGEIVASPLW